MSKLIVNAYDKFLNVSQKQQKVLCGKCQRCAGLYVRPQNLSDSVEINKTIKKHLFERVWEKFAKI